MKAVVVAAGMGSRLWNKTNHIPKTLLPFDDETILFNILKNISQVGIRDFVIVVGYEKEHLISYLNNNDKFGFNITFVENTDWHKGNGISVLAAEKEISEDNFLLSMSDHLVSVSALDRVVQHHSPHNLLLIDPDIQHIFDLDDATKVDVQGTMIIDIGKEIPKYNGVDCGIFRLTKRFFTSMREQLKQNQESISAAVRGLIQNNDMEAVFLDEQDFWIDIDTPESYQYALKNLKKIE